MRASLSKLTLNASRGSLAALAGPAAAGRRTFATARRLQATYGFIGLGQMGESMQTSNCHPCGLTSLALQVTQWPAT